MGIILWIIFGAIVGFIANSIMGEGRGSLVWSIILGIFGSMVGGFIFSTVGEVGVTGFNLYSVFVGVIGALIVIYAARLIGRKI